MNNVTTESPFFKFGTFGHNPFVYKNEVYRFNPTVAPAREVLKNLSQRDFDQDTMLLRLLPTERPVIVGIIDKVYDDPFMGMKVTPKKNAPESVKKEAKQANDMFVEMNGIEFHRQMYQFMIKERFEGLLRFTSHKGAPDELPINQFLYFFCINFFAEQFLAKNEPTENFKKAIFFKKVFEDGGIQRFNFVFLGSNLPKDKTYTHFFVWEQ